MCRSPIVVDGRFSLIRPRDRLIGLPRWSNPLWKVVIWGMWSLGVSRKIPLGRIYICMSTPIVYLLLWEILFSGFISHLF